MSHAIVAFIISFLLLILYFVIVIVMYVKQEPRPIVMGSLLWSVLVAITIIFAMTG